MLQKSINYWSYPGGLDGQLEIETFLHKASRDGFDAVELCIGETGALGLDTTEDRCRQISNRAASLGVPVNSVASGIYWQYALASASEPDRRKAVESLRKMIKITSWLGAKTLLTITGAVDVFFLPDCEVNSYDHVDKYSRQGLLEVIPFAESMHVRLGIENVWNKFLLSPLEMATFIDSFNSPAIGAYVDVANVAPYGYAQQWLKILGPRVAGIYFKDFRRAVGTIEGFVDLLEGDVDWPEVMAAIVDIGYQGPLVAEMIPLYKHYPEVRVQNTSRAMDAIMERSK